MKPSKRWAFLLPVGAALLLLATTGAAWGQIADPTVQLKESPLLHIDLRPAGMGGAFTAVADDENALFYNPAGLAKVGGKRSTGLNPLSLVPLPPFNLVASLSEDAPKTPKLAKDVKDAYDQHKGNMAEAVKAIYDVLEDYMPFKAAASSWGFPHSVGKGWGVGLLTRALLRTDIVERGGSPFLRSSAVTDAVLSVAGAGEAASFKLLGYKARVYGGLALKGVYRGVVVPRRRSDNQYLLGAMDIYQYMQDHHYLRTDWEDGLGYGLDLGLLIGFEGKKERLTLGLAWQDAITRIKFDEGWRKVSPRVRLGVAYRPPLTQKFGRQSMILAAEIDDLTNEDRRSLQARLRCGVELHVGRRLWLRGGISHGYGTAGLGLKLGSLEVQWAWYAEEERPLGYTDKVRAGRFPDRRHVLAIRGLF